MTKCLAKYHAVQFGARLDRECHGCARMVRVTEPLNSSVKPPPQFSDKCPMRVESKS